MKDTDAQALIELCDKAIADLHAYDSGTDYSVLQIGSTLGTIATPLLQGNELDPGLRSLVPATSQLGLLRSARLLAGASGYQRGHAHTRYGGAIVTVKNALQQLLKPAPRKSAPRKVFYSWQSTSPNATNRGLIGDSLRSAIDRINQKSELHERIEIDRDTLGATGSPDILDTVLKKIEACDAFVADVSLIAQAGDSWQCNSNVMLETGYALSKLGAGRIVLVFNEASGSVKNLPFDLNFKRVLPYRSAPADQDRAGPRKRLSEQLQGAIEAIFALDG